MSLASVSLADAPSLDKLHSNLLFDDKFPAVNAISVTTPICEVELSAVVAVTFSSSELASNVVAKALQV